MSTITWLDIEGEHTVTVQRAYEQTLVTHLIESGATVWSQS